MFKNYDEILQRISEKLMNYLDEKFLEITLDVERTSENSIGYTGMYINFNGDEKNLDFWNKSLKLQSEFHKLYQTMTAESDKHKWNRAKVTLTNDGKLNIKFEWDQELADELEALSKEYDPRWDDSLSQEEKEKKYKEMVQKGELPDLSKIEITYEEPIKK